MYEWMVWLEGSALAQVLRDAGVWTYGLLNLAHIIGISTLFGAVLVLDLRMLGAWHSIPLPLIARPTVPLAAAGFAIALISGMAMITFNTTEYHGNLFLYIKLPVILFGLLNVVVVQRLGAWRNALSGGVPTAGERWTLACAGAMSLVVWLTVVGCGRMIGYW